MNNKAVGSYFYRTNPEKQNLEKHQGLVRAVLLVITPALFSFEVRGIWQKKIESKLH